MTIEHVLIIGGGYLSVLLEQDLLARGHTVVIARSAEITICSPVSLREGIEKYRPTLLINTVAFTDTKAAELPENQVTAFALNVQGPANLLLVCREHNLRWVHFSTGMLFDGNGPDGQGFREEDLPTPPNYYAWTKYWGDCLLQPFLLSDRILNLRIHLPISATEHPRNFLNRLLKFDKGIDVASSVTVVEDLCRALGHLLETEQYGVYNVANPGIISAYGIMQLLQAHGKIEADKVLTPLSRAELDAMGGARQTFPYLNTDKLLEAGVDLPEISQAISSLLEA